MSEKPILFSTPMVRAILQGQKSMTRRVIKPQPPSSTDALNGPAIFATGFVDKDGEYCPGKDVYGVWDQWGEYTAKCRWQIGDILWVRETWERLSCSSCEGDPLTGGCVYEPDEEEGCYVYRATDQITGDARWHSSMFMPRKAARIFLKVANVRVERLQDITEEDAINEGVDVLEPNTAKGAFYDLWSLLNDKRGYGWEVNPFVWVVRFERIKGVDYTHNAQ